MDSKLMSLEEAISTYVQNGDLIGIGGLSFWRKPICACREIVRQAKKNLSICTFVGGIDVDMLVGGGCACNAPRDLEISIPNTAMGTPTYWMCGCSNSTQITAYSVCLDVSYP